MVRWLDSPMPPVPSLALIAFAALTLALLALWTPRVITLPHAVHWWTVPLAVALVAAVAGGLVGPSGLIALLVFAVACRAANRAASPAASVAAHVVMLAACAALLLHIIPGFNNPRVLSNVVLGPGSEPYSKYLNFDKGVVGLFLLGIYAPDLPARDSGAGHLPRFLWRFVVLTAVVLLLALALGYLRWDPKLPSWWPVWTWSMLFLTALPEEAIFRGVVQTAIWRRLGGTRSAAIIAIAVAGTLFGAAHAAGGYGYVVLATAAGIGYGWIYAATGSIAAAILAHAALNTIHFLLFSYPALAGAAA
jgi:membrane protease YdiL (CAAX protease family)